MIDLARIAGRRTGNLMIPEVNALVEIVDWFAMNTKLTTARIGESFLTVKAQATKEPVCLRPIFCTTKV